MDTETYNITEWDDELVSVNGVILEHSTGGQSSIMPIHGIVAILCTAGLVVGVGSVFSASKRGIVEWVVRGTCYIPRKPYPTLPLVGFFPSLPVAHCTDSISTVFVMAFVRCCCGLFSLWIHALLVSLDSLD